MKAIILCPGPSLSCLDVELFRAPDEIVIAVNRAALAYECHVWAATDSPLIEKIGDQVLEHQRCGKRGTPALLSTRVSLDTLADRGWRWPGRVDVVERMRDWAPPDLQYGRFSACSALIYAAWRGAGEIVVYGADWSGTADYDGVQGGRSRSDDRWRDESQVWLNRLVPWLASRGISVTRIAAQEPTRPAA